MFSPSPACGAGAPLRKLAVRQFGARFDSFEDGGLVPAGIWLTQIVIWGGSALRRTEGRLKVRVLPIRAWMSALEVVNALVLTVACLGGVFPWA